MRVIWIIILVMSVAQPALAGAWLREKGKGFSSYSISAATSKAWGTSTYLEYGLTDQTTLGAETGFFLDPLQNQAGFVTAFFRRGLNRSETRYKLSYEIGAGAAWNDAALLYHLKTGLSFGKPLQIGEKYGWLGIEGSVRWDLSGNGLHLTKIDTTVGLNFTDRVAGMMQLYTTDIAGDLFLTLAPSAIIKSKNSKFKIQIGAETDIKNPRNSALKIGLWREF